MKTERQTAARHNKHEGGLRKMSARQMGSISKEGATENWK